MEQSVNNEHEIERAPLFEAEIETNSIGNESDSLESDGSEWSTEAEDGNENSFFTTQEFMIRAAAQQRESNRTVDDDSLPKTVTLLRGKNFSKVYLIGTAHFSKESCEEVKELVQSVQPDVVVLELCVARSGMLNIDESTLAKKAAEPVWNKMGEYIKEKGVLSGLITMLMMQVSIHLTKQLGIAPGGEFRTAFQEAKHIPGTRVLLGDRQINITLQRAFAQLSYLDKIRLCFSIMKDFGPVSKEDVEKLKDKDMLEQALGKMMKTHPELVTVFCTERDIYLANSIQSAASGEVLLPDGTVRSPTVLAVVGIGHSKGIIEHFNSDIPKFEIEKIVKIPEKSMSGWVVSNVIKVSLLSLIAYGMFRFGKFTFSLIY